MDGTTQIQSFTGQKTILCGLLVNPIQLFKRNDVFFLKKNFHKSLYLKVMEME